MADAARKIEVDESTATALEALAAEQGVSVSSLVASLARAASEPAPASGEELAELDRRWKAARDSGTVPHETVVKWLETWGTPGFKRWHSP